MEIIVDYQFWHQYNVLQNYQEIWGDRIKYFCMVRVNVKFIIQLISFQRDVVIRQLSNVNNQGSTYDLCD